MTPRRTRTSACSPAGQVGGLAVGGGQPGGLAGRVAGGQGVEGHRRGDLAGPQGDPGAGLAGAGGGPGLGHEVVGQDGDPVALADRLGGAGGQQAEGGDLDPAGDAVAAGGAGGEVEGQPQLDAGRAVAGGERAGVIAEAAGDGDADRVHGFSLVGVSGRGWPPWWRPGDCGALPGGQVPAPRRSGPVNRPAGRGKMFSQRAPKKGLRRRSRHQEWPAARGKDLCTARGERSERPVAGTDAAAQADKPGKGRTAVRCHHQLAREPGSVRTGRNPNPITVPGIGTGPGSSAHRRVLARCRWHLWPPPSGARTWPRPACLVSGRCWCAYR